MSQKQCRNSQSNIFVFTIFSYSSLYLRATQSELAVETFFPQSYGGFKQRDISEFFVIFWYGLENKTVYLLHIIDIRVEPARP